MAQLASADPATCDRAGLAELVTRSQRVHGWLDAVDARIAVHASRLAEQGTCEAASTLLAGGGRRAARAAEPAAAKPSTTPAPSPAVAAVQQTIDKLFTPDGTVTLAVDTATAPPTTTDSTTPTPAEPRRGPPPRAPAA